MCIRDSSGTLSYARTPAIAAALGTAIATAIAATMVTAIADGDLLHGCYEGWSFHDWIDYV